VPPGRAQCAIAPAFAAAPRRPRRAAQPAQQARELKRQWQVDASRCGEAQPVADRDEEHLADGSALEIDVLRQSEWAGVAGPQHWLILSPRTWKRCRRSRRRPGIPGTSLRRRETWVQASSQQPETHQPKA